MDVIGLSLAGSETPFGQSTRSATLAMSPSGSCRIFGTGEKVGVTYAAFANAAFAQALEFDDTHNDSIVHMSSPAVAASLALSETRRVTGKELILAIESEVSRRANSTAADFTRLVSLLRSGLLTLPGGCSAVMPTCSAAQLASAAASLQGSSSAGLTARNRSSCIPDGPPTAALRPPCWRAQA
jgi:hypothetical protein